VATRLVVFGRQGAGKGTQCVVLAEHYHAVHISTGDMLRAAVAAETPLGLKAKAVIDSGGLVGDDLVLGMLADRLAEADVAGGGFLLDGVPRTVGQAEALVAMTPIDLAVDLDVPETVVRERMLGRGRADDTPEAIDKRLALYAAETVPVIEWFAARDLLLTVDGMGTPDDVTGRLVAAIDARLGRS
jgi:adenylate kinase